MSDFASDFPFHPVSFRSFVCPYHPERVFNTFSDFASCPGCLGSDCDEFEFDCQLVELYAHTAYLNNLHFNEDD